MYTNYQLFKEISTDDTGSLVKRVSDEIVQQTPLKIFIKGLYEILRNGKSDQKAEFALDLIYAVDPNQLIVPAYIDEGLEWLQSYLDPEEWDMTKIMPLEERSIDNHIDDHVDKEIQDCFSVDAS